MPMGSARSSGDLRSAVGLRGSYSRAKLPEKNAAIRRYALTGGLVAVAILAASFLLCRSSSASSVELTTAALTPAGTILYVGVNTDLDSSQWVAAFRLAEKFGATEPREELEEGATAGGFDWEDDIEPFLGGDAAFFLRRVGGVEEGVLDGGFIIRCTSTTKALAALRDHAAGLGIAFERRPYGGGVYEADDASSTYIAGIGEHVVIALNERTLKDVVDIYRGDAPALAQEERFQRVRDGLVRDFLAFVYVDLASMRGADAEFRELLLEGGIIDSGEEAFGGVVTASNDLLGFEHAFRAGEGALTDVLAAREPGFATRVPDRTALFVSTTNLAAVIEKARTEGGESEDIGGAAGFLLDGIDSAWLFAGAPFALSGMGELTDLFTGEVAVASWPEAADGPAGSVLMAEVADPSRAWEVAGRLAGVEDAERRATETIAGTPVTMVRNGVVTVLDGVLIAGSPDGVRAVLEGPGRTLAENPAFARARERLGAPLGSFVFVNVAAFAGGLFSGAQDEGAMPEALESVIFNAVIADGLARFSAILLASE